MYEWITANWIWLLLGLGVLLLVFRRGVSGMGCGMGDHGGHGRSDSSRNELTTSADKSRDAHQHHGSPERTEPSGRAARRRGGCC